MGLVLYDYWRSGASYRVRIGLNLKGVAYESRAVNLLAREQEDEAYRAVNPQALVPSLEIDGRTLTQSSAILEWIEETWLEPRLLPADPLERAAVRAACAVIGADTHPLHNLRVSNAVKVLGGDPLAWTRRWLESGFTALEALIGPGPYAFGGTPTMADCYLVPMGFSARRFGVDVAPYPRVAAALQAGEAHPAIAAAHPDRQADALPSST